MTNQLIDRAVQHFKAQDYQIITNDTIMDWLNETHPNHHLTFEQINTHLDELAQAKTLHKYYCFTPDQLVQLQNRGQSKCSIMYYLA